MNSFFAMHSRMKYITRWSLMRNSLSENISEHSNDVAAIAHAIAIIKNLRFGGNLNADRAATMGLYHDMPEIITGDMPTPVKYHSKAMRDEFEEVENIACNKLLDTLPDDMKEIYKDFFFQKEEDKYLWKIVKAADKISALIKCIEETNSGNKDFSEALISTKKSIDDMNLPEVNCFMDEFIDSFYLSLDEINR